MGRDSVYFDFALDDVTVYVKCKLYNDIGVAPIIVLQKDYFRHN